LPDSIRSRVERHEPNETRSVRGTTSNVERCADGHQDFAAARSGRQSSATEIRLPRLEDGRKASNDVGQCASITSRSNSLHHAPGGVDLQQKRTASVTQPRRVAFAFGDACEIESTLVEFGVARL
jgi:hypothetical protein